MMSKSRGGQERLNAVIVGYGGMGKEHAQLILRNPNLDLIGIYDIDDKEIKRAQDHHIKTYGSLESVLKDDQVHILVIATPNHEHKPITIKALEAGKHVVCEKPVTLNSTEFEEILKVVDKRKKKFFVHQNRRWDEDYLIVKDIFDKEKIGNVFHIESKVHGSRGIPGDWRKEKAYGGGMMLDWGVHLIDRLLILMNEPVDSLFCKLSYIRSQEVDDGFTLHLTFKSGKTALVEVGTYNYSQMPLWYVLGSEGALVIEDWNLKGSLKTFKAVDEADAKPIVAGAGLTKTMAPRDEDTLWVSKVPRVDVDYNGFYTNVYEAIQGFAPQIVENTQVMTVMKLMEAAIRSSKLNQVIVFEN